LYDTIIISKKDKLLEEVIIKLNIEYPKFLKAIPKMNNKEILKHPLMKSLEELKCLMSGQKSL